MKITECNKKCYLDYEKDKCSSCNRPMKYIRKWKTFTIDERKQILKQLNDELEKNNR